MRYFLLLLVVGMNLACSQNKSSVRDLKVYYDLDSLLNAQIYALGEGNYVIEKTVDMDGKTESMSGVYDSTQWRNEFKILRDFDLNKSYNVGAYSTDHEEAKIYYTLSDKTLDAPVKWFSVGKNKKGLEISAEYFEDKVIYQHKRMMKLKLEDGMLLSFEIKGYQKMALKDTAQYQIQGTIKR